jgi:hypothetical protein
MGGGAVGGARCVRVSVLMVHAPEHHTHQSDVPNGGNEWVSVALPDAYTQKPKPSPSKSAAAVRLGAPQSIIHFPLIDPVPVQSGSQNRK